MKPSTSFVIAVALVTTACAPIWVTLGYKPSESGPKATLNFINQNEVGTATVIVFANPDCTGQARYLTAPIPKDTQIAKLIDAERPFSFSASGNPGSSSVYEIRYCQPYGSFTPKAGKTYHLTYRGDSNKCNISLAEQTASGQRIPIQLQRTNVKRSLSATTCE